MEDKVETAMRLLTQASKVPGSVSSQELCDAMNAAGVKQEHVKAAMESSDGKLYAEKLRAVLGESAALKMVNTPPSMEKEAALRTLARAAETPGKVNMQQMAHALSAAGINPNDIINDMPPELRRAIDPNKVQKLIDSMGTNVATPAWRHLRPCSPGRPAPWHEHLRYTHFEWTAHAQRQRRPYEGGTFDAALAHYTKLVRKAAADTNTDALKGLLTMYGTGVNLALEIALLEPMFEEAAPAGSIHGLDFTRPYSCTLELLFTRMGITQQAFRQICFGNWHLLQHHKNGKRVYQVDKALSEALADTSLRGLVGSDLHLPYDSVYVQPPEMEMPLKVYNPDTGWHRVTGIYVANDIWLNDSGFKKWRDFLTAEEAGRPYDPDPQEGTDYDRVWTFFLVGEDKGTRDLRDMTDDAIYWFRVPLMDRPVAECVNARWRPELHDNPETLVEATRLVEWVANVMMYVTCANPGETVHDKAWRQLKERIGKLPKNSGKRKKLLQQLRNHDPRPRIILKSDKITVDRARAENAPGNTGTGRKQTVRCKVAGHYRMMRVGPGRTGRKHTWIEPFWRGPEMGEIVAKRHFVK